MENENQKLIDITSYPIVALLDKLLEDKTTKKNIIWATDVYAFFGDGFQDKNQILSSAFIMGRALTIRPRIEKNLEEQQLRTKKKAEVFTPAWLCNQMNNYLDEDWFGSKSVFNVENKDNTWTYNPNKISFKEDKIWEEYIKTRCLEITCGEAPFLVSRYDTSTGVLILPPFNRIGLLDRKLRIINENIDDEKEWIKWVTKAYQNTYGFEYQGDNLLIARINLLLTFIDYYKDKFNKEPELKLLQKITNIITWNIWQMDGLKDTVPLGKPFVEHEQIGLDLFGDVAIEKTPAVPCIIKDWRANKTLLYMECKENNMSKKLFDYVIGNPPYQEESRGNNESDTPIYHYFLSASQSVGDKSEMIHPARFLFNAGGTPKAWNEYMLSSSHLKIEKYVAKSSEVFPNTDIKGGVAITYFDNTKEYEPIGVFTSYNELNSILKKVEQFGYESLSDIITNRGLYRYSDMFYLDYPEANNKTADSRIAPSAFERMPDVFVEHCPDNEKEYIRIFGNIKSNRCYRWIKKEWVNDVDNLHCYKVLVPKANGSGAIGEVLSTPLIGEPLIGEPLIGYTETYISIGETNSYEEANSILKYVKTKFSRTMLGILKVTQNNAKPTWKYVPLQDFTSNSDIDWSKSIHEIDLQLYKKYGLDEKEIEFIETHVKEMN